MLHSFHWFVQPTACAPPTGLPSLVLALGLVVGWTATPAAASAPSAPRVEARTAVVMDAATGAVLWQRQAHRPVLVASTTKILTAIVANDHYPARKVLRVPEAAERVAAPASAYRTGWLIRRDQMLTTLLLVSATTPRDLAAAWPGRWPGRLLQACRPRRPSWAEPTPLARTVGPGSPGHKAAPPTGRTRPALLERLPGPTWSGRGSRRMCGPAGRKTVLGNHNNS